MTPQDVALVSEVEAPARIVDGQEGARVRCRVAPQGTKYAVSAEIVSAGTGPAGEPLSTDISLSVLIGAGEADAQGTLYAADQKSMQARFSSDTVVIPPKAGCLFSVASTGRSNLGVGQGIVWGTVSCAHLGDQRNQASEECAIDQGFFAFENCEPE